MTSALSNELIYSGRLDRLEQLSADAVDVARRVGDLDTLAVALWSRWNALTFPDLLPQAAEVIAEIEALTGALTTARTRAGCQQSSATYAGWTGERDRMRRGLEGLLALADFAPPASRWQTPALQAGYELRFGDLAIAEERSEELLRQATETGEIDAHLWHLNLTGFTLRQQGRIDDWVELYTPFLAADEAIDLDAVAGAVGCLILVALCEGERNAEARALAPRYFAWGRTHPRDTSLLPNLGALAVAAAELGDRDEAVFLLAALTPFRQWWSTWGSNGPVAPVSTLLGRLHVTIGDFSAADAAFGDAVAHCRANQSRFFLADALLHQGRAWQARGDDAPPLLEEALQLASAGGYLTIERRAQDALGSA